jgi:hypothetical protein
MHLVKINCKEYAMLVSERMDRSLSFLQRVTIRLHEWICPPCRKLQRQLAIIRQCCRWKPDEEPRTDEDHSRLPPEAAERIKCTLRQCAQNLPSVPTGNH